MAEHADVAAEGQRVEALLGGAHREGVLGLFGERALVLALGRAAAEAQPLAVGDECGSETQCEGEHADAGPACGEEVAQLVHEDAQAEADDDAAQVACVGRS